MEVITDTILKAVHPKTIKKGYWESFMYGITQSVLHWQKTYQSCQCKQIGSFQIRVLIQIFHHHCRDFHNKSCHPNWWHHVTMPITELHIHSYSDGDQTRMKSWNNLWSNSQTRVYEYARLGCKHLRPGCILGADANICGAKRLLDREKNLYRRNWLMQQHSKPILSQEWIEAMENPGGSYEYQNNRTNWQQKVK